MKTFLEFLLEDEVNKNFVPHDHHKFHHDAAEYGYNHVGSTYKNHPASSYTDDRTGKTVNNPEYHVSSHNYVHPETGHELNLRHSNQVGSASRLHSWNMHPEGKAKESEYYKDSEKHKDYGRKYAVISKHGEWRANVYDDAEDRFAHTMKTLHPEGPKKPEPPQSEKKAEAPVEAPRKFNTLRPPLAMKK